MVNGAYPWLLVGPWYRWSDPYDPNAGRVSRPIFQKYETSDFSNEFLKDPQHSLKFIDPDDLVERPGRTGIRKIYLDLHKRFYLVVCELHCDTAGFPNVNRAQACDTGFVVRRRVPRVPKAAQKLARVNLHEIAVQRARMAELEALPPGMKGGAMLGLRAEIEARYAKAHTELVQAATEYGISVELQGWIPGPFQGVGAWAKVEETPASIQESIFPLYPLIPDPRVKDHSGGGRTIYFGVLPTSTSDVDAVGNPRFDDRSLYEVRCFVRRHDPRCPKRRERNHCKGDFAWSRRTESYQLASQFDLLGTSNRPVNIFLPDLPALEKQAAGLLPGQGAPVRMIAPPDSNLEVEVDPNDFSNVQKKTPGAAICSFSIPLITIVASFVFRLFLPVVTLLFGLWFLLKLKFCIPPMLELDAGVAADLDVALGKVEAGIDVEVAVDATLLGNLELAVDPTVGMPYGSFPEALSKAEVFGIAAAQSVDFSQSAPEGIPLDEPDPDAARRPLPAPGSPLEFEERVEVRA